jgi:uncharacterized protein (TIGR02246 family)
MRRQVPLFLLAWMLIPALAVPETGGAGTNPNGTKEAGGKADAGAALRETVRARETAFARTMAERDRKAFAGFLAEDAVFVSPKQSLRGREQIVTAWKPFFDSEEPPFSWTPEQVEVDAAGDLALSTGPVNDASGARIGTFVSTWRKEADGVWRVVFDGGCPPCGQP